MTGPNWGRDGFAIAGLNYPPTVTDYFAARLTRTAATADRWLLAIVIPRICLRAPDAARRRSSDPMAAR